MADFKHQPTCRTRDGRLLSGLDSFALQWSHFARSFVFLQKSATISQMFPVRIGLIGCGGMGQAHAAEIQKLWPLMELVCVCDANPDLARRVASRFSEPNQAATPGNISVCTSAANLISSGLVEAVVIAVPHLLHADIAILALDAGLHVFVEKPLAVRPGEARRMLAAARRHPHLQFAIGLNQRSWPVWKRVKHLIDSGALGRLSRISWTLTDWFRTQAYFDSSSWRGTWAGEGGGLLVNQCPHNLDLLLWFAGRQPLAVQAVVALAKHHTIETEDEVYALIEFEDGLVASFIASTGEATSQNLLTLVGDLASLTFSVGVDHQSRLALTTYATPTRTHIATSKETKKPPATEEVTEMFEPFEDDHQTLLRAFALSVRGQGTPLVGAADGLASVDLAAAILLAGLERRRVEFPPDTIAFDALLDRLALCGP